MPKEHSTKPTEGESCSAATASRPSGAGSRSQRGPLQTSSSPTLNIEHKGEQVARSQSWVWLWVTQSKAASFHQTQVEIKPRR